MSRVRVASRRGDDSGRRRGDADGVEDDLALTALTFFSTD